MTQDKDAANPEPPGKSEDARLCSNCGADLRGPYCWYCGQPTRSFIKFFPALVRDVASDTFNYDARLWRTLKPLMISPGFLSREYVSGRRARYTPPFRIYIIVSLATFLMVGFLLGNVDFGTGYSEQYREVERSQAVPSNEGNNDRAGNRTENETAGGSGSERRVSGHNSVQLPWLGERGNGWFNRKIDQINQNSQKIQGDPGLFLRASASMLPQMMFVLLPLFAAVITVFYLFSGRYYVEHLILLVHNHAFIFLVMLLSWPLAMIQSGFHTAEFPGSGIAYQIMRWLIWLLWLWIPVYLLIGLKRFYQQGWILTLIKYFILTQAYLVLFMLATAVVAVLGILRL